MTSEPSQPQTPRSPDPPPELDAHALMLGVAAGDRAALGKLVEAYHPAAYRLAFRFLHDAEAAEDIAQDAFLRVLESADRYQPSARFTTWLYRIVANLCFDAQRRNRRTRNIFRDSAVEHAAPEPSASTARAEAVQAAVAQLPERQRLVLVLHRFHGMSHKEIAEITEWTTSAVESCLVRAYDGLRKSLAPLKSSADPQIPPPVSSA